MFNEDVVAKGHITIYKIDVNGDRLVMYDHRNTLHSNMYNAFGNSLITRSNDASIDYMAWGTYNATAGTFIDGTYVGTGNVGTNSKLIMSLSGSSARFVGTFGFLATKQINYFQIGRGYNTPTSSSLITTPYAYNNTLNTGSTWITYENGETLIVDWTIVVGV